MNARRLVGALLLGVSLWAPVAARAQADAPTLATYRVDHDGIAQPLTDAGDAGRGYQLATRRESGCILCHQLPSSQAGGALLDGGNIGPPLAGVASRYTVAQLRLRLVDSSRINAGSLMPSYHRVDHLQRVAPAYAGQPVLQAQQIEDVLAWLANLK